MSELLIVGYETTPEQIDSVWTILHTCGATMIIGPILTALQLTTFTLGFDTS